MPAGDVGLESANAHVAAVDQGLNRSAGRPFSNTGRLEELDLVRVPIGAEKEVASGERHVSDQGVLLDERDPLDVVLAREIIQQHDEGAGAVVPDHVGPENEDVGPLHRQRVRPA